MSRIQDRVPRESFQEIFRPMIRTLGAKNIILRLNEAAKIAIPRQTSLDDLMPKLEMLCYEQKRQKVEESIEQLWEFYLEHRLGEGMERFGELSDQLNDNLEGENLPKDEAKREVVKKSIQDITVLLKECKFTDFEIEAVFRVKAYPEVLQLFLESRTPEKPKGS
jgi:hypothetical protein